MGCEKTYTAKEIEEMLWLPCCHVSGMHNPTHFDERKFICSLQKSEALERFCKQIGINPKTKSKPTCGWCADYPKKKNGEGLPLFDEVKQ